MTGRLYERKLERTTKLLFDEGSAKVERTKWHIQKDAIEEAVFFGALQLTTSISNKKS